MREQDMMRLVASFVASFRREALADGRTLPLISSRQAAVLLIDVVGFTAMGDDAVRQGVIGAEKLAKTINQWLDGLFRTIATCGGEVYVVAGDAILAVWFVDETLRDADAVAAAVHAGLSVHADRCTLGTSLSVRSSVGRRSAAALPAERLRRVADVDLDDEPRTVRFLAIVSLRHIYDGRGRAGFRPLTGRGAVRLRRPAAFCTPARARGARERAPTGARMTRISEG